MKNILLFVLLAMSAIAATTPPSAQFLARRDYVTSGSGGAQLVRAADINGDKIPDIIATNPGTSVVWTLLGNGTGTYRTGPTTQTGLQGIGGMALLDLNGDGVIDLVVSGGASSGLDGIGVCFGNGNALSNPPSSIRPVRIT